MDLIDGMRTFAAVVEAGSFTAAADRLGISKKLASKYVAELEARLRVRLLHRTTRSLSLTEAGRRYYPRCVELLSDLDDLESCLREGESGLIGTLRVAAPVTFGELYVQPLLAAFRQQHPDLEIDLRLNDRYVDLASEGFDLAIRIGALEDSSILARKLGRTELWAVASPEYLEAAGLPETPHELAGHVCIRDTNLKSGNSWPFSVNGQLVRIPIAGGFMVNSATAVRALALAGEGITLTADYAVAADVAEGRLLRILEAFPSTTLDIQAVFLDARRMPARTRAAVEALATGLGGQTGWSPKA